jgi:hypothetical protein
MAFLQGVGPVPFPGAAEKYVQLMEWATLDPPRFAPLDVTRLIGAGLL